MNEIHEETYMLLGLLAFAAFGLWLLFKRHQLAVERSRLDLELRNKLLEKFATAREFLEFAQTPDGRRLLTVDTTRPRNPYLAPTRFLQAGVISVLLGAGFLLNSQGVKADADINFIREAQSLHSWGVLFIAAGLGQTLAALIAYVATKKQGLADDGREP